jgi:hypothetical protein
MLMGLKLPIGDIDSTGLNADSECKVVVEGLWLGKKMSRSSPAKIFLRTPFETSP